VTISSTGASQLPFSAILANVLHTVMDRLAQLTDNDMSHFCDFWLSDSD